MQTEQEQVQLNAMRLERYQAKLTEEQRTRSKLAAAVQNYCNILSLGMLQASVVVRIALVQFDHGAKALDAYRIGTNTARTIAAHCAHAQHKEQSLFVSQLQG